MVGAVIVWTLVSIICFILFIFCMIAIFQGVEETSKNKTTNIEQNNDILKDFSYEISETIGIHKFLISKKDKKIAIRYDGKLKLKKPIILNTFDLLKVELIQDDIIIKEKAIGRAIVGGLIAGGVGSIVGATSAREQKQINTIVLKLSTNDINNPIIKINLYDKLNDIRDGIMEKPDNVYEKAEKIIAILEIINQ